jgi:deazaflavin-dependent oxidoreductase (nitroreductase family)
MYACLKKKKARGEVFMAKTGNQKSAATRAMFVMKMTNIALSVILRSPFHGRVSETLLLLTFRGRKSGKKYRFPVGYMQEGGGTLVVLTPKMRTWWKNFRDGGPVSVYVQGKKRAGIAKVALDDEEAVAEGIRTFLRHNPKAAPMYRVELNAAGEPTLETLQRAVVHWVVVRIHLEA